MRAGNEGSGRAAGPFTTVPAVVKREPWHGQSSVCRARPGRATVHPSWVQVRETATTLVAETRVTARDRSPSNSARVSPTAGNGVRMVRPSAAAA